MMLATGHYTVLS